MRIVMLVRNPCTRDARVLREAAALTAAGHEVTIIALAEAGLPRSERRDGFAIERIDVVPPWLARLAPRPRRARSRAPGAPTPLAQGAPTPPAPTPPAQGAPAQGARAPRRYFAALRALRDVFVTAQFAKAARAIAAGAYHAHDLNVLAAAARSARAQDARLVYDAHEFYPGLNGLTRADRIRWSFAERRLIRRADAVVTVGDAIARELVRRYRIAPPVVVRNVPGVYGPSTAEVPAALRAPGIKLLYVGWIARGRGLEPAVRALPLLPDARLLLLGGERAPFADELRALAASLGVQARVEFLGATDPENIPVFASHATAGLVTIENVSRSYYLSLPNKLFECLHAGLPVIGSDFPEIGSIVRAYDAGATCDPSDPNDVARAVREVTADGARYERLRANARAAARELTWEIEREKLVALYERTTSL
jgi:glycosyltransferase involved in cell wall biosynthesis